VVVGGSVVVVVVGFRVRLRITALWNGLGSGLSVDVLPTLFFSLRKLSNGSVGLTTVEVRNLERNRVGVSVTGGGVEVEVKVGLGFILRF